MTKERSSRIDELLNTIAGLQDELEAELAQARDRWSYRVDSGRVRFEREIRLAHKRLRQRIPAYLRESRPRNVLAAPIIYSLILPIAVLDVWISLYQFLCFPLFGIDKVSRREYLVIDRHKLGYLNGIEKMNCVYCGYANGVFAYVREVTGRTEQYWCPIRHARRVRGPHAHYREFVDYGDAAGYARRLPMLRKELKKESTTS